MKHAPGLILLCLGLCPGADGVRGAEPRTGYQKKVSVGAATRLDWTFALSNRSLADPPADWLGEYDSKKQQYDLFVPPGYNAKKSYPLILFVNAGKDAGGWDRFELVCRQQGVLFAAPHDAGNDTPEKKRTRIVLDVLDDVRRTYNTDPDRTYLAGVSGGARMADAIAFALPEHFGGVLSVVAGWDLRQEPWLRQRVIDRLSVALVTGETDFNRSEVERFRGPYLKEVGVRARVWMVPKMGHEMPRAGVLAEALRWLEDGLKQRQALAKRYPASRIAGDAGPSREGWAKMLLEEGKGRLEAKETLYTGLMQLKGCLERWNGLPAADEAKKILLEYEGRKDRAWEAEDIAEQRRFLLAEAHAWDAYATGPLSKEYVKTRNDMLAGARRLWERLLSSEGPESKIGKEAKERIAELDKRLEDKDDKK
jgi:predicted esterase